MRLLFWLGFLSTTVRALAQSQTPAPAQSQAIVLEGGTVHVGNGQVLSPGYVVFEGGKIRSVSGQAPGSVPGGAQRLNVAGKHVYPGLIVANNTIGLDEVGAVRATHDYAEVGELTPEVWATTAFNAASEVVPTLRANGVLTAHVSPRGYWLTGQSGLVQLDAWNAEDATLEAAVGQMMNIPPRYVNTGWWAEPGQAKPYEKRPEVMAMLERTLQEAKTWAATPAAQRSTNLRLEALAPLFSGRQILFIAADAPRDIVEGLELARRLGIPRRVLLAGPQCVEVADYLAREKVPVILSRIHSLPSRQDAVYDEAYAAPAKLRTAGVDFCLDISGDMEPMQARNLGLQAATATGFGLSEEQALEAVTLAPARILGQAGRLGSLEPGKDATLIVTDGPLLSIPQGKVAAAYIQGRAVSLDTKQKQLYRRYAGRYGLGVKE